MDLIVVMAKRYMEIISIYIKNKPYRIGDEGRLCDEKHQAAENFLLQLGEFIDKNTEVVTGIKVESDVNSSMDGANSEGLDDIIDASLLTERPSSAASSKSGEKIIEQKPRSLIFFLLNNNKPVANSPSVCSSVSITTYRKKNNINDFLFSSSMEEQNSMLMEKLEEMFREEKLNSFLIRQSHSEHKEGRYDAILYVIIENINFMKNRYAKNNLNMSGGYGNYLPKTPHVCDTHKRNLLLFISTYLCAIAYDRELYHYEYSTPSKKIPYSFNSGYFSSRAIIREIEYNLNTIASHIFDSGYQSIKQYAKTMSDLLDVDRQLNRLTGVSNGFISMICSIKNQIMDEFIKNFPDASLQELVYAFKDDGYSGKQFSLEGNYISGEDSPFAPPKIPFKCTPRL